MRTESVHTTRNDRLIKRRLDLELTQEQVAEEAGLTSMTVHRAEKGLPIQPLSEQKIARALQSTREKLFGADEPEEVSA